MTDLSPLAHLGIGVAAIGAGLVNAIAGGGTLITFPVLTAFGVPAIRANATNTVSLCPGYMGGAFAQRKDLEGLGRSIRPQLVAAAFGGFAGSVLLIMSSEAVFKQIVPFLIIGACVMLAVQDRLRGWISKRSRTGQPHRAVEIGATGLTAVYGGYFLAGQGIMMMAVLGLFSTLPFNRLNAVKQTLSSVISIAAASFLVFSGKVEWTLVLVMAPASLIGGHLGGNLARVLPPARLRVAVIVLGLIVAAIYLVR